LKICREGIEIEDREEKRKKKERKKKRLSMQNPISFCNMHCP
jgi:hypothetical protein